MKVSSREDQLANKLGATRRAGLVLGMQLRRAGFVVHSASEGPVGKQVISHSGVM